MGGMESRAVTIENPYPQQSNVITITTEVDKRLSDFADGTRSTEQSSSTPPAPPLPPPPPPSPKPANHYCQQKYEEAERLNTRSNQLMETQFATTVNHVNALLGEPNERHWSDDFVKIREELIACHKKHPNEPLMCLQEVERFQKNFLRNPL